MTGKYLLLGTNLGDRFQNLHDAKTLLRSAAIDIISSSAVYESAPWGNVDQPWFYNQVIQIETSLSPLALMHQCLKIELDMGRIRFEKWGQRLIDIDLLYYENEVCKSEELTLPHPEIFKRKFTLMPLAEIAKDERDPVSQTTIDQLLKNCPDTLDCQLIC